MQSSTGLTDDDYLARERISDTKHELLNGRVIAMAGSSPRHNAIVANLLAALVIRLRGTRCRPLASDQRIHIPATGLYTYPDVSVVCGELEAHPKDAMTVINPRVLAEVLSDGTEAYDRGAKFAHYRGIASLQTYLMLSQHDAQVERYERGAGGVWVLHESVGCGPSLELPALEAVIPLAEIYADLPPRPLEA